MLLMNFFTYQSFNKVRPNRKARVVTSIAMFYDLEAPNQFVADVASLLEDDGVWGIELSYLPTMLLRHSFDTICHKHLEYYTLRRAFGNSIKTVFISLMKKIHTQK